MPKTSLQSLIRSTVSAFQKSGQPYNLATVLKNLNAPKDFDDDDYDMFDGDDSFEDMGFEENWN